jgi:hypothetical protein
VLKFRHELLPAPAARQRLQLLLSACVKGERQQCPPRNRFGHRGLPARFERGLSEPRHRTFEPCRCPGPERSFDDTLAIEMNEWLDGFDGLGDRIALVDGQPRPMQLCHMP